MTGLRERLRNGDFVLGTFAELPSPALVEILGHAGFDFVIIDREHGSIDLETAEHMIRAAQASGISPMVRVAENHPVLVRQPLDMGAAGVQVPQIGSPEAAQQVVRSAMFAPEGERGLQPFVRAAAYGATPTGDLLRQANENSVLAIHIEGEEGARNLEQILQVDRIDVIFIGPYDLSQSLGIPGQTGHPRVEERIREIAALSRAAGKCVGIYCDNPASVAKWREIGVTYAALSMDARIFGTAAGDLVRQVKNG
jgi:4-hydroxy-2-oxoheptanedioate aldolase